MQATRVIPSFLGAMHKHQIIQFDQNALDYWIIEMFLQTMKPATVQRYLGTLHTIYKGYTNFTPPIPIFNRNSIFATSKVIHCRTQKESN